MVNFYCAILLLVSILTHTSTNLVLPESRANNAVENGTDVMENRSEVDIEDKSQLSLGADLNTNIESPVSFINNNNAPLYIMLCYI